MTRRPSLLAHFAIGAAAGAFLAVLHMGPLPFSLRGLLATLAAGAVGGSTLASAAYVLRTGSRLGLYAAAGLAGLLGGSVWWLIVRPESALIIAALVGGAAMVLMVIVEDWGSRSYVR